MPENAALEDSSPYPETLAEESSTLIGISASGALHIHGYAPAWRAENICCCVAQDAAQRLIDLLFLPGWQ